VIHVLSCVSSSYNETGNLQSTEEARVLHLLQLLISLCVLEISQTYFLKNTGLVWRWKRRHSMEAKLLTVLSSSMSSIVENDRMSLHLQICSLGYKGYPRGVEGTPKDAMMVSAIINVLALRFCEGNNFYAFSTNFPKEGEVKNLAQVRNSNRCIVT